MGNGTQTQYVLSRHALRALPLLLFVGLLGACDQKQVAPATQSSSVSTATAGPKNGRYVVVLNPNARADTFLLDTQSGKVWRPVKYTDLSEEPTVWEPMTIVDNSPVDATIPGSVSTTELIQMHKFKPTEKKAK